MTELSADQDGTPSRARPARSRAFLLSAVQVLLTIGILGVIASRWGWSVLSDAVMVIPLWAVPAALVLGGTGVAAQALRWRLVARCLDIDVAYGSAVARCWQAAFLNSVLPGGLAGDALRAVDDSSDSAQRRGARALLGSTKAIAAERLCGTAVVCCAAGAFLLSSAWLPGVLFLLAAVVTGAVAWLWLRLLPVRQLVLVALLSVAGWAAFVGLFFVAAAVTANGLDRADLPALGAVTIAGMSVPLGVGGWGPREAAAGWVFSTFGYGAQRGVSVSIAYGVLALVSTLPGAVVAAVRVGPMWRRGRAARLRRAR